MRKYLYIIILSFFISSFSLLWGQNYPFQDSTLNIDERVEDLLSRLTLDEKLSMMQHRNPAIPSLGLPAYSWWNEALHGVGRNGLATVFPMPIALAASFDEEMVQKVFALVAFEARLKYYEALDTNTEMLREPIDYTGLTFFTPNINIFRDPRWGRGMETYGEDPFLTARMGLACVNGLQHNYFFKDTEKLDTVHLSAAACLKHLAVHSGPEGVRHEFDARVSPRDLWTTYLPAFEYIIKNSDVQQVMCGYNRLNGEPCCTNKELLIDILRHKWHYDGLLVTDCWALNDCWERDTVIPRHKTHASAALTAADAFGSEVDLECGSGLTALRTAVDSGYIDEEVINKHVRRILRTRLRVMEMSPTGTIGTPDAHPGWVVASTLVLLKNNKDLLPLEEGTKIYLTGPNATDTLMPLGNYNGTPYYRVSIQDGLGSVFTLVNTPKEADVIVYAGGLNPQLEGEELPVDMPGFYKGDRTCIELPEDQCREIRKLQRKHRPVVLLLCSGSAIALDKKTLKCDAIMQCWYGGEDMGNGVALSMLGFDGFGRLPVTFYKSTKQLPPFESYDMAGRTYRYMTEEPLYPFGYGLSYAKYGMEDVRWKDGQVCGTVRMVKPSRAGEFGGRGSTVVEVYLKGAEGTQEPHKQLVGFQRVTVAEGELQPFEIDIDPYWLRQFDEESQEMVPIPSGSEITLLVGFSSADKDLVELKINHLSN
ncbi:MAG: glycoside hydrolase family 3 C-terminal domain-containing protein [Bacteroidales bacterium]|nr:glycoside hydrolase family 3 C-terminal domain-containing protein [Bacteroidales bacterium]